MPPPVNFMTVRYFREKYFNVVIKQNHNWTITSQYIINSDECLYYNSEGNDILDNNQEY
jgi:hypothetical protein